ncbi:DUF4297 domain-containing protein [Brevibacillus fluminis]|uniref:DUF4297 domain-containing protein n=1 Tax=Brevibacillus fluminis TaxID=511487 RepID=A0A3M8CW53_9BACL|nr:dsDNA nuclease domain-containing protein [Brevibacillus fluminis]RNB79749.1 DUF4297 domain-containing protein [Brevibacillus fluminis]
MVNNELSIFQKTTDAIATNRGFLYQYLVTLNTWVNAYIKSIDTKIYCETEDDIKELNTSTNTVNFTQIKCYSSDFSLKSDDIQKALFNFFILYSKYDFEYVGEFFFVTNSSVKKRSDLLLEWVDASNPISDDLMSKIIPVVQELLSSVLCSEKDSIIAKYTKMIKTREGKKSGDKSNDEVLEKEIAELVEKMEFIESEYSKSQSAIVDEENIKAFIQKIRFSFENEEPEDSIESIRKRNLELIITIPKLKCLPNVMQARLLTEVYNKSSQSDIENRVLTIGLLNQIIDESLEEISNNVDSTLTNFLNSRFDTLEGMVATLLSREVTGDERKTVYELPIIIDEVRINEVTEQDTEKQSNLERKIRAMGIEDADESDSILELATQSRCSYLIHLDKLQIAGLNQEYQDLKQLEYKVRRLCLTAVQENKRKNNFDPVDFWVKFQDTLSDAAIDFGKLKSVDIDEEVVYAQMYQIAAECPLRWTKEKV